MILAAVSLLFCGIYFLIESDTQKELASQRSHPQNYDLLIAEGKDTENRYVKVVIADIPYPFAVKEANYTEQTFYFLFDENNYMYLARLTDETYEKIVTAYNKEPQNFAYTLEGYIFETEDQIIDLAIDTYNETVEEEIITTENYRTYFGNTYLDETVTPNSFSSAMILGGALAFALIELTFLIIFIYNLIKHKATLKKYDMEALEYELSKETTISYPKYDIYLTDKYLISQMNTLTVLSYENITRLFIEKRTISGLSIGFYLMGQDTQNKKYQLAYSLGNEDVLKEKNQMQPFPAYNV